MLARIGLLALALMVGSEAFVASATVLWPIAALSHLGTLFENGAIGFALLLGAAAACWLWLRATKRPEGETGF